MKKLLLILFCASLASAQTTRYVAPAGSGGSDSNPGTIGSPYLTIGKAVSMMHDGDTTYLRGGTYAYTGAAKSPWLDSVGTSGARFYLWAYPGEVPILDYNGQNNFGDVQGGGNGLHIRGDYWHIKGISVTRTGYVAAIVVQGSHNIFENCKSYNNGRTGGSTWGAGFYLYARTTREGTKDNLFKNCDSWNNYDSASSTNGGNYDGFGTYGSAAVPLGPDNRWVGCRAWLNSDDGFDWFFAYTNNVSANYIRVDSCIAFRNGYDNGNGNGFKLGGGANSNMRVRCTFCLAAYNSTPAASPGYGFTDNASTTGLTVLNCTGYKNEQNFGYFGTNKITPDTLVNCLSYANINANTPVVDAPNRQTTNSWNGFTVTDADFQSVDSTGFIGTRNADGSLPTKTFLRLVAGSDMTDAGTNVGLPYSGAAPDVGAFEYAGATPIITVTGALSNFGSISVGSSSGSQTYTVSGSNLTTNITVTAPSQFAVSTDNATFGSSVTLTQSGGTVASTTVYARFSPTSTGIKSGNITHTSTGATTRNVAVSGTGADVAACPDQTATMHITWAADPGCYDGAIRGRPIIVGNEIKADNGYPLRGLMIFVSPGWNDGWNFYMDDTHWTDMVQKRRVNCVRADFRQVGEWAAQGSPDVLDTTNAKYYGLIQYNKAKAHGLYYVIDAHSGYNYDSTAIRNFWSAMARQFKDSVNAIFLTQDEPVPDRASDGGAGDCIDYSTADMAWQRRLYWYIRLRAPNTMIVTHEIASIDQRNKRTPQQLIHLTQDGYADSIDYQNGKAVIGWHGYPTLGKDGYITAYDSLKAVYPQWMTALGRGGGTPDFGALNYGTGNYGPDVDTLEAHGMSWISYGFPYYNPHDPIIDIISPSAHSYHVATTGSNSNNGTTMALAWRNISTGNANLHAGDTLWIHTGTYPESISPVYSGTLAAPIVYKTWGTDVVKLTPTTTAGIEFAGKSYIKILGRFWADHAYRGLYLDLCNNILIDGFQCDSLTMTSDRWGMLKVTNSHHINLHNMRWHRHEEYDNYGTSGYGTTPYKIGDGLQVWESQFVELKSDTGMGAGHYQFLPSGTSARMFLIRDCLFSTGHGGAGMNGSGNQIYYRTSSFRHQFTQTRAGTMLQMFADTFSVIYCTMIEDTSSLVRDLDDVGPIVNFFSETNSLSSTYGRFANNTIVNYANSQAPSLGLTSYVNRYVRNHVYKNNVIYHPNYRQTIDINDTTGNNAALNDSLVNNYIWRGATGADSLVRLYTTQGASWLTYNEARSAVPGIFLASNVSANPLISPITGMPDTNSPVIDASLPLTYATNTGTNSTNLTVGDPNYFCPGWADGMTPVLGDSIRLGLSGPIRRITSITGSALTLNASASWANGAGIYLWDYRHWTKQGPDLGGVEYQIPLAPGDTLPEGTFTVSPAVITGATNCTFTWTSEHATSASISPTIGTVLLSGNTTISVSATTTYTLTLTNLAGTRQYQVTVTLAGSTAENIVRNGQFENAGDWNFYSNGTGNSFERTSTSPYEGSWSGHVTLGSDVGTNTQLYQFDVTLDPGVLYRGRIVAKASSATSMYLNLYQHVSPYVNYGLYMSQVDLTTDWAAYTFDFTSTNTATVNDGRLQFQFNNIATANREIWIDTVYISSVVPPEETFDAPVLGSYGNPYGNHLGGFDWFVEWSYIFPSTPAEVQYVVFQYASDPAFTTIVLRDSVMRVGNAWSNLTSYPNTVLPYGTHLYVRAMFRNGAIVSPWSEAIQMWTGGRAYLAPVRKMRLAK